MLERKENIPITNLSQASLSRKIRLLNHRCSRHNFWSHWHHFHEDESPLNSSRATCARDGRVRVFLLVLPAEQLWHSVRTAWSLLACRKKQRRNVGVVVSYRVTAEMFENPGRRLACDCFIQGSCSCRGEHQEIVF